MMIDSNSNKRKPNTNRWTCPIDGVTVNSRGAASYIRIKYGIVWDSRYLDNPELLFDKSKPHSNEKLYGQLVAILSDFEFDDLKLRDKVLEELYKFMFRVGLAAKNEERMNHIIDTIFPITSSKLIAVRKDKYAT